MSGNQVSDILAQAFAAEGVDTLFTLMGDANMYWSASMAENQKVRLIHARKCERRCLRRATGKVGVGSVTCGRAIPDHDSACDGGARQCAGGGVRRRRRWCLVVHSVDRSGAAGVPECILCRMRVWGGEMCVRRVVLSVPLDLRQKSFMPIHAV